MQLPCVFLDTLVTTTHDISIGIFHLKVKISYLFYSMLTKVKFKILLGFRITVTFSLSAGLAYDFI